MRFYARPLVLVLVARFAEAGTITHTTTSDFTGTATNVDVSGNQLDLQTTYSFGSRWTLSSWANGEAYLRCEYYEDSALS